MNDEYDPEFDSPEARANFATRHIWNVNERKKRRDELLIKYSEEQIVEMFPGHSAIKGREKIETEKEWF